MKNMNIFTIISYIKWTLIIFNIKYTKFTNQIEVLNNMHLMHKLHAQP